MFRIDKRGMTLIDVLVGIGLMLVMFFALFGVLRASLSLSALGEAEAVATNLASTQMEYLRGLSYDALGTVGGIPSGNIPEIATTTVDGIPYSIRTFIEYYDDPADGVGVNDTNGVTTDYKKGKVTVSYSVFGIAKSVTLISNFVPPGIESATPGGTLQITVLNASGNPVEDANVTVVDASTTPTINLTTFTNASGIVLLGGAATSSAYQIYVSKSGYSSAQTYARTNQNVNPTPGYLTVTLNQTTGITFVIDQLATLVLSTFSPALTTSFSDTFANTNNLASETGTQTGSGLTLTNGVESGSAYSIPITPSALDGWGMLSASLATPSGTTAVIHVDTGNDTPLPNSVLPGNSAGFSSFPISLTGIATSTYPTLTLEADLTSTATNTTPVVSNWSLSYTEGPLPLSNVGFTLTGSKTIGTTGSGAPIYKNIITDSTNSVGQATETLEWDAYSLTLGTGSLIESCPASPYALSPAEATSTALIVGTPSTNTLPVVIENSASSTISNALVVLSSSTYAASIPTSACGLSYFNNLIPGTYSATVSAPGHTTTTFPNIVVSGHTATTTLNLP